MPADNRFAIIANPRTGSNHFIDLLNSHPDITCHREAFHPHAVYLLEGTADELLEDRNRDPLGFLEKLFKTCQTPACGFKIFMGHDKAVLESVLSDKSIRKIILYRANYLAVYSSEKIAEAENCYVIVNEKTARIDQAAYDSTRKGEKAIFDKSEFNVRHRAYQEHYRRSVDTLNSTGQAYLFMTYEDFLNESFFRRVFPFLGLSQPAVLETRMSKMNASDILSRFSNPEEVRAHLLEIGRLNWTHEGFMPWGARG